MWVEMKALNMDGTLKARSLVSWCGHRSERFLSFTLKQGVAKSSQKLKADINEVKRKSWFLSYIHEVLRKQQQPFLKTVYAITLWGCFQVIIFSFLATTSLKLVC